MSTVAELLQQSGLPALEGRALLARELGVSRESLVAHPDRGIEAAVAQRFEALVARRRAGEPFAHLLGEREFYGRMFRVTPDVLIPRPETELLVDLALAQAKPLSEPRILDLGTGSGCIAISLALELPAARVTAVDGSGAALAVASANAERLGARVRFLQSDWYAAVDDRYDVIVANPPYVADGDWHLVELQHEPRQALVAADQGLACLAAVIKGARRHLAANGWLLLEHGFDQAAAVRDLLVDAGFATVGSHVDAANIERVSGGTV